MKAKYLSLLITFVITMQVAAQRDSFDISNFISPKGWQRLDSNGVLLFHDYKTQNNLTSFCQIFIFPSRASNNSPDKNFQEEWNIRIAQPTRTIAKPQTATEKTPDGWTAVTGITNISQQGITYTCILVAITGFNKVMSIAINVTGQDYMGSVESFLNTFELDSKATVSSGNTKPFNTSGAFDWNNYGFIVPERWLTSRTKDYILLAQSQNVDHGCVVMIFPPQPSSGNLEADARNIFSQMYPGWQFRYTGEKQYDISMGRTPQGLEYVMMEGPMHKMRPDGYYYDYEDGAVWVINLGKQIAVVTGRHNRLIACFCNHQYEYWRRFFNSFTVKNQPASKPAEDPSKRIIGDWMAMGGGALTEYIFAANGNYQFIGAYSTSTTTTRGAYDYIEIKTSSWKGDGSYSIKGSQLTFKKHGRKDAEQVKFRFEKVNHGGTGWKERLYMLQVSLADGKEFEVCYEKRGK